MPISTIEHRSEKVLEVHLSGKLSKEDYQRFVPLTEQVLAEWGKFSLLVILKDFHGIEAGAAWEELKWDMKHFNDVERIAFVGEEKWHANLSQVSKPITGAEIRYFDVRDIDQARAWVVKSRTMTV